MKFLRIESEIVITMNRKPIILNCRFFKWTFILARIVKRWLMQDYSQINDRKKLITAKNECSIQIIIPTFRATNERQ